MVESLLVALKMDLCYLFPFNFYDMKIQPRHLQLVRFVRSITYSQTELIGLSEKEMAWLLTALPEMLENREFERVFL